MTTPDSNEGKALEPVQPPPLPPAMMTPDIFSGAEGNTYLGTLTESDARQLVNRHFSLTRLTDMIIHEIVNDNRFTYNSSFSAYVRHAVELLTDYYVENRLILEKHQGFATDILRSQNELRLDAERARIRMEFSDNIKVLDKEMDAARQMGDWEFIGRRLTKYLNMLENCESETQRQMLREILSASVATRSAAIAFYRWLNSDFRVPVENYSEEWPDLADKWYQWYNDLTD